MLPFQETVRFRLQPRSFCREPGETGRDEAQTHEESGSRKGRRAASSQTQANSLGALRLNASLAAAAAQGLTEGLDRARTKTFISMATCSDPYFSSAKGSAQTLRALSRQPADALAAAGAQGNGILILAQRARGRDTLRIRSAELHADSLDSSPRRPKAPRLRQYRSRRRECRPF